MSQPDPMNELIAAVDDERDIVDLIDLHLKMEGLRADGFLDARSFFESLERRVPGLALIDLMLCESETSEKGWARRLRT